MVAFNYSTMQMTAKVVYYGPGLGGKTTNLQFIYNHTAAGSRGEMVLLETEGDRTLFFDLLPLEVGSVAGFRTRVQLYTVPGQVFYNTTRKLVLKGVDGVVFVADSQRPMLPANVESFQNLAANLREMDIALESFPLVLQYNKRDLPDVLAIEELDQALNRGGWPSFEASALAGRGVFETLRAISRLTLRSLKERLAEGKSEPRAAPPRPVGPRRRLADALAEFERIRREALEPEGKPVPPRRRGAGNGSHQISRDIRLTLGRGELARTRRLRLSLRLEGDGGPSRELARDLALDLAGGDLDATRAAESLLLRLNIALSPED